jgi:hypothetical protein
MPAGRASATHAERGRLPGTAQMTDSSPAGTTWRSLRGRTFLHPFLDYTLIGGGLSLLLTLVIVSRGAPDLLAPATMAYVILVSNSAHFAASTVRLYTKPGAVGQRPFLSHGVPWIAFGVMTGAILLGGRTTRLLETVYLTWSPYHYAAQAYGLAVVYSFRSGCRLRPSDKRLLWWAAMPPFFYMTAQFLENRIPDLLGLSGAALVPVIDPLRIILRAAGCLAPLVLYARVWRSPSGPMPLISLMTLVSNAVWFFVLDPLNAFLWATVFHGIQYLAIVMIFDVRDQTARAGNARGPLFHSLWFYGASLLLGYGLFVLLPNAYRLAGLEYADARLVSISIVNIHHFIVDAYIWRLGSGDSNRRIVEEAA